MPYLHLCFASCVLLASLVVGGGTAEAQLFRPDEPVDCNGVFSAPPPLSLGGGQGTSSQRPPVPTDNFPGPSTAASPQNLQLGPSLSPLPGEQGSLLGPQIYLPPAEDAWTLQVLPAGIIFRSYMAGAKESRFAGHWYFDTNDRIQTLDATLGGRIGILRYGTRDALYPQGWQLDIEGAGQPRLNLDQNWDVDATDFRFGIPLTYGVGNWQYKFAYYHLSAHLGDEFAIRNPGSLAQRINYARDALVLATAWYPVPEWRLYAEASWAFYTDDGAQPWEFQFGADYSCPGPTDIYGTPFFAVNGHLREDVDFGGNLVVQTGWLWRGNTGSTVRMGLHYYNGKSSQFEFFDNFEQQVGFGIWVDN